MREMSDTAKKLTRAFTNSPDTTPKFSKSLNRARNEAEEAIVYVDNATRRSTYSVRYDDDDEDQKYDGPLADKKPSTS